MSHDILLPRFTAFTTAVCLATCASYGLSQPATTFEKDDEAMSQPVSKILPPPSVPPDGFKKEPIPDATQTARAVATVRQIFQDELAAANTPDKQVALAEQFTSQAGRTSQSPDRWALLIEATRLATEAGNPATTFAVIDAIADVYAVDPIKTKHDAIVRLLPNVSLQAANDLTLSCLELCRTLIDRGELAEARKMLTMAVRLTKKARTLSLMPEVAKLTAALRHAEKTTRERDALLDKLAANPNDPELCLEAGSFFCFKANDWEKGLPLLAKAPDGPLSSLAKADLHSSASDTCSVAIGDAWWDWAMKQKGDEGAAGKSRALHIYDRSIQSLEGLDRIRIEQRIKNAATLQSSKHKTVFLADVTEDSLKGLNETLTKNGTYQGSPYSCGGKRWPKALMTMPRHNEEAIVRYTDFGPAKRLTGHVGLFLPAGRVSGKPSAPVSFHIRVDGVTVWRSPPMTACNDMHPFDIVVTGAKTIELVTFTSNAASAWGAWLDPTLCY